ncbi:hypothetical protein FVQ89_09515 [Homoserinibacter sp. GY 40078]|nr:hypothetical protein FVQ89_09515 [Homoserinibacter sp. GY 40078]
MTETLAAGVPDRSVRLAYGEKQSVDGTEIIPVALVTYGFGGGQDMAELGTGGGGGGVAVPVGAYIGGPDGLRFRPNTIALLAVAIPVIGVIGWSIARIVKAA